MLYITYNDLPSGIYFSQVIDVCSFLRSKFKKDIKLIAFISVRNFFLNRKKIKKEYKNSIILPMFPGVQNWRLNVVLLIIIAVFVRSEKVIARGPFACVLSFWLKKFGLTEHVCFDSRGAYTAEINEYDVYRSGKVKNEIQSIEKICVINSDFRISVSHKLVEYWQKKFDYMGSAHVVIPCTIISSSGTVIIREDEISSMRRSLGFIESDIILAYSGSSAGWQSFNLLDKFLMNSMKSNINIKVLFLSKSDSIQNKLKFISEFKDRVILMGSDEKNVLKIISCADYGLLLRENSVTNEVSAPVKFAEYLFCGLKVIISNNVGDYTEFVTRNKCGSVIRDYEESISLHQLSYSDRKYNNSLAVKLLSKENFLDEYKKVVE